MEGRVCGSFASYPSAVCTYLGGIGAQTDWAAGHSNPEGHRKSVVCQYRWIFGLSHCFHHTRGVVDKTDKALYLARGKAVIGCVFDDGQVLSDVSRPNVFPVKLMK